MIQSQIYVVQGIANFMRNGGSQTPHYSCFFNLMKFRLKLARCPRSRVMSLNAAGQRTDFITLVSWNTHVEIAGWQHVEPQLIKYLIGRVKSASQTIL